MVQSVGFAINFCFAHFTLPLTMDIMVQQTIVNLQDSQKAVALAFDKDQKNTAAYFTKLETMIANMIDKMNRKSSPSHLDSHPVSSPSQSNLKDVDSPALDVNKKWM